MLAKPDLIALQRDLETSLTRFAETELPEAVTGATEPAVYEAARSYLARPSKRLLGMTFLVAYHALSGPSAEHEPGHLLAVATALEIRHAGILLHDDIVDGDVVRGGQSTAHHALAASSFSTEGRSAAIFVGDLLAALAPLPILHSGLTPSDTAVSRSLIRWFVWGSTAVARCGRTGVGVLWWVAPAVGGIRSVIVESELWPCSSARPQLTFDDHDG